MAPASSRLIDNVDATRTRPMKVLALGLSRTGTSSLRDALIILGFKPYHFREMMLDWRRSIPLWTEALEAKYFNKGKPYGCSEFDRLIGDFDAVEDNPSILFGDELIAAYPAAKVILTNRDVDEWITSMEKTVFRIEQSTLYRWLHYLHPLPRAWFSFVTLQAKIWYDGDYSRPKLRKLYHDHYEHIRATVPNENILELELGDGWEPLCKFLGVPVPSVPYPHANDAEMFQKRQRYIRTLLILALAVVLVLIAAAFALLVHLRAVFFQDADVVSVLKLVVTLAVLMVAVFSIARPGDAGKFYHGLESKKKKTH